MADAEGYARARERPRLDWGYRVMAYGKSGYASPAEVHNEALRLAQRAVAKVFDETGDQILFPMCLTIIGRLEDMKREKRKRRTPAEMAAAHGEG